MDRKTAAIYQAQADEWVARRRPKHVEDGQLDAFALQLRRGGQVVDLGCGPGWYAQHLSGRGVRVAAMDVAMAMLAHVRRRAPAVPCVCGDLAALPFADRSLSGAWAANCYVHVHPDDLPLAFAGLHAALRPGAPVALSLANLSQVQPTPIELQRGEAERRFKDGELPGRLFTAVTVPRGRALLVGAGFERVVVASDENPFWLWVRARRARTLPDLVRPGLRLLVCGLNPSLFSADAGIPFARPGNRFWAAARQAGLIAIARDPLDALRRGIGMTDLVKRATTAASHLRPQEYAAGLRRVEALVQRHRPGATCFVGLDGWRCAVDRRATPGWIAGGFGGRPAYLMPSTSGRNARVPVAELAAHLRTAAARR
jgi:double-stranded uracil-DNA glycosylase